MEIGEFIEQDIMVFLDNELDKPHNQRGITVEMAAFLTRDYEEEMLSALDTGDLTKAKRVLHDLKERFDEVPNGTSEKKQLKILLASLYDKFKDHLDAQNSLKEMDMKIEEMKGGEQPAKKEEKPLPSPIKKPAPPLKKEPEKQKEPDYVLHANKKLDEVERLLQENHLHKAAKKYRNARKDALHMERVPEELAKRFTDTFAHMKAQMVSKEEEKPAIEETVQTPPVDLDKNLLMQMEREKHRMDEQLHKKDFSGAMLTYRNMRTLVQQMTDPVKSESAAKKLVRIYNIIQKLTQHAKSEKQMLRDVP